MKIKKRLKIQRGNQKRISKMDMQCNEQKEKEQKDKH